jgi:hypothetical protein
MDRLTIVVALGIGEQIAPRSSPIGAFARVKEARSDASAATRTRMTPIDYCVAAQFG